jgi:hypothetical protein
MPLMLQFRNRKRWDYHFNIVSISRESTSHIQFDEYQRVWYFLMSVTRHSWYVLIRRVWNMNDVNCSRLKPLATMH